jgi:hypothetical protein
MAENLSDRVKKGFSPCDGMFAAFDDEPIPIGEKFVDRIRSIKLDKGSFNFVFSFAASAIPGFINGLSNEKPIIYRTGLIDGVYGTLCW